MMKLLLSTAALPGATPDQLLAARKRHGFAGFEIDLKPHHLSDPARCPLHRPSAQLLPDVAWYRMPPRMPEHVVMHWANQAHASGAGLILPEAPPSPLGVRTAVELRLNPASGELADAHGTGARPCWRLDVHHLPDRDALQLLLRHDTTRPVHIRLAGAGPEVTDSLDDDGLALRIGAFFGDLAVLGYEGSMALVPSNRSQLEAWRRWLLDERGWGCGTAAEKKRRRLQPQNA